MNIFNKFRTPKFVKFAKPGSLIPRAILVIVLSFLIYSCSTNKTLNSSDYLSPLTSEEETAYSQTLERFIADNYTAPENTPKHLKIVVELIVTKDGKVPKGKITSPSGDWHFDRSVLNFLKQINSLPALPESFSGWATKVTLIFLPLYA